MKQCSHRRLLFHKYFTIRNSYFITILGFLELEATNYQNDRLLFHFSYFPTISLLPNFHHELFNSRLFHYSVQQRTAMYTRICNVSYKSFLRFIKIVPGVTFIQKYIWEYSILKLSCINSKKKVNWCKTHRLWFIYRTRTEIEIPRISELKSVILINVTVLVN